MSKVILGACVQCDCQLATVYDCDWPLDTRDPKSKHYLQLVVCGGCGLPHPEHEHSKEGRHLAPEPGTKARPAYRPVPVPKDPVVERLEAVEARLEAMEARRGPGRPRKAEAGVAAAEA